jgi:multiple sugar transport system permease protein
VLARLQTIPEPLYEAARMDGASAWGRFWDITIPQLRGVLVIVVLLRAIWDFKEFDLIFLLTGGGPLNGTETLPLLVYQYAFAILNMGKAATVAVLMLVTMLAMMMAYLASYGVEAEE